MDTQNYPNLYVNYNSFGAGSAMYEGNAQNAEAAGDTQGRIPGRFPLTRNDIIANTVAANSNKLDGLAATVQSNTNTLASINTRLDGFTGDFNQVKNGLAGLKEKVDSQSTRLQGIATDVNATRDGVTALNRTVQGLDAQFAGFSGRLNNVDQNLLAIGRQNTAILNDVNTIAANCSQGSLHQTPPQTQTQTRPQTSSGEAAGKPQAQS
jgi:uncharacterized protein YoxC